MSIAALPSQTVRAIGSTQALTDSASVVKELLDNALDAHSTNITIEISTNALDVIQVKDNGHGIAPTDYALVGKRYCTSKIKDLDDLAKIGGASLGFRGEALASAIEMSGGFVLSTRVAGEATGVSLKVSHNGEVANDSRVSQPVGTTVRITDFLKSLPVRRQTALKDATKQLAKIKRTLQAYALARPSVRLGLKVLKAKNEKDNWTYAPKSEASVSDAAIKIVSKKVTDQCQWVVWHAERPSTRLALNFGEDTEGHTDHDPDYNVEAMIPRPGCDLAAVSNTSQYISVDSRPVSSSRGTFKQIVQLFKSYLQSSSAANGDQKPTNPFLCMNVVCPPGTYDANVEPAKDDVLFTDTPGILKMVEDFFKSVYGGLKPKEMSAPNGKIQMSKSRAFDLLLAKRKPPATIQPALPRIPSEKPSVSISEQRAVGDNLNAAEPEGMAQGHNTYTDERRTDLSGNFDADTEVIASDTQSSPVHQPTDTRQPWRQSMYGNEDVYQLPDLD
ncbi:MAG: hypothetical protein Q9218_006720, partial [Villophora microphyllina]